MLKIFNPVPKVKQNIRWLGWNGFLRGLDNLRNQYVITLGLVLKPSNVLSRKHFAAPAVILKVIFSQHHIEQLCRKQRDFEVLDIVKIVDTLINILKYILSALCIFCFMLYIYVHICVTLYLVKFKQKSLQNADGLSSIP